MADAPLARDILQRFIEDPKAQVNTLERRYFHQFCRDLKTHIYMYTDRGIESAPGLTSLPWARENAEYILMLAEIAEAVDLELHGIRTVMLDSRLNALLDR